MIGKNIAEIRKLRGYSISELSELTKISKSYLSNIERNINTNPSIDIIEKIAASLEVDLITLVKNDDEVVDKNYLDEDCRNLVEEFKRIGIDKNQIKTYKTLIEFIKWQNDKLDPKKSEM